MKKIYLLIIVLIASLSCQKENELYGKWHQVIGFDLYIPFDLYIEENKITTYDEESSVPNKIMSYKTSMVNNEKIILLENEKIDTIYYFIKNDTLNLEYYRNTYGDSIERINNQFVKIFP